MAFGSGPKGRPESRASPPAPADLWNDGKQLANLPEDLKVAALSPEMATALGRVLRLKDMDAVPLLTAAQKRARQDFRLNLELGLALDQGGRSEEALGHFRAALAVRPESSAAYNGLGTALFNLGRRKEAGEHFEEALQLDPMSDVAHQNLGVVLQFQGRLDEAIGHFEQALSIDPHFAWAHANLGTALAEKVGWTRPSTTSSKPFGSTLRSPPCATATLALPWAKRAG